VAGDIQVQAMTSGVKTGSEDEPELLPETPQMDCEKRPGEKFFGN